MKKIQTYLTEENEETLKKMQREGFSDNRSEAIRHCIGWFQATLMLVEDMEDES